MHVRDETFILSRVCFIKELTLPRLKMRVENAIQGYLTDKLTDEEFEGSIQSILDEFKGKNLLHQNIGQLTWEWEKKNPSQKSKFEKLWILLEQVSPRIIKDFNRWREKSESRKYI